MFNLTANVKIVILDIFFCKWVFRWCF